jgi:WD40 repeat protein
VLLFPVLTHADIQHQKLWSYDNFSYLHNVSNYEKLTRFSDDGSLLITTRESRLDAGYSIVKIWDVKTLKCIQTFKIAYLLSLTISPDNKTMAVIKGEQSYPNIIDMQGNPYSVETYSIDSGALEKILVEPTHGALSFTGLAFSPDSKFLVTGSGDSLVRIWDLKSGKAVEELRQGGWTKYMGFTHRQTRLVALGGRYMFYRNMKLWSLHPKKILKAIDDNDDERVSALGIKITSFTMAPNGKWFATNNSDRQVQIFNSDTLALWQHLPKNKSRHNSSLPIKVVFSSDSKLIAFVRDGQITIRKASNINEIVQTFPIVQDKSNSGSSRMLALSFSKSGKQLQWVTDENYNILLWKADMQ